MENYIRKAAESFFVNRPYGIHIDYKKQGYVLFNRQLNVLGNRNPGCIDRLPLERFGVEEIPLDGKTVEKHPDFTNVYFYDDHTNPYMDYVLDFGKLKNYNRYMYTLAMILGRDL